MVELGIQKGEIVKFDNSNPAQRSRFYSIPKLVRDILKRLNVPYFDKCCPDASTGIPSPVGYNSGLQYYNGTAWVAASESAFGDGTVSDLAIKFGADGNNGFYGVSDTELGVAVEGAKVASFDTTGLKSDTISETTATHGVAVDGVLLKDGGVSANSQFAGFYPVAAAQALSGAGAINVTSYYTAVTTTGANALTLADGTQIGQLKSIKLVVDGGDGTLTPAHPSGFATITFNDAGDYVKLLWNGTAWILLENFGAAIA